MMDFSKAYNRADFVNYLRRDFLPDDFEQEEKNVPFWTQMNYASVATCLGKSKTLDLVVYEIKHRSLHDARVGLSKDAFRMLAGEKQNRALVIFVPENDQSSVLFLSRKHTERIFRQRNKTELWSYSFRKIIRTITVSR